MDSPVANVSPETVASQFSSTPRTAYKHVTAPWVQCSYTCVPFAFNPTLSKGKEKKIAVQE